MVFEKRNLFIGIFVLVLIGFLVFVYATATVNLPVASGNYSSPLTINITVETNGANNMTNITCYYNSSGGAATTWLTEILNDSLATTEFANTTIVTTGWDDGSLYNISCSIYNSTTLNETVSIGNITIDNTAPNVTFSGITNTINNGNYSGTIVINVSAVDATIGMGYVYFNITNSTSDQHNFTLASTSGGGYYNISLNTAVFPDGVYNITVYANDTQLNNLNNTEKIKITIDNTAPYEINFTSTTINNGNYSGNLVVNVSVLDALSGIGIVFFNVTNSSGQQNATYTATKSGNYYNATIPTASFSDGTYNITAWTNDSAGNSNNTAKVYSLTFDNTAPTGSVSCTPATVVSGNTVTCSCSPSDATSGINSSATSITANPSTANTGTYTSICSFADMAGNTGSASGTYNVEQGGTSSSSSGSGTTTTSTFTYSKTIPQNAKEFSEVKIIETSTFSGGGLKVKERVKIKFNNEEHHIGVREVTATSATVEIASEPVQVSLDIGEDAKVDVDEDDYYDIYVKLNGIANNVADLTIEYLHEVISEEVSEGTNVGDGVETSGEIIEPAPEESEEKTGSQIWIYVLVGIIILIIIGIGVGIFKNLR